jgi:homoaconitase/3-isopropylmalate dehydratase large subunit
MLGVDERNTFQKRRNKMKMKVEITKDEILKNVAVVVRPLTVSYVNGISKEYKGWCNKWLVVKRDNGIAFLTREALKSFDLDEEFMWLLAEGHSKEDFEIHDFMGDGTMFIGTCNNRLDGAYNAIANVKKAFKTLNTNKLWVIPSSIHEVIFIADREGVTKEGLSDLIRSVNETEVSPEEVLGTTPLYFEI